MKGPTSHGLYLIPIRQDSLLATYSTLIVIVARLGALPFPSQHLHRTPYNALCVPRSCRACRSK